MCLLPVILPSILFHSSVCPNHNKTLSPQWLGPRKSARPASSVPSCLPPAKQRSLPFCCRWGGVLRRMRAVFQQRTLLSAPHSEKANSTQRIDGIGKEGRRHCGGCWTLGNYKQSFFPKGAGTDRAQRRHITSKREKQINSCASSLSSAQVYAGAVLQGGGDSVCVSRGGLASVGRSSKVSFASANETELGWSMSPWQQAISTSLSRCISSHGCLSACQSAPSLSPSLHCRSHHLTRPIELSISLNLSLTPSKRDKNSSIKDECHKLLWMSQWIRLKAKNWHRNMLWSWNLHGASVPSDDRLAAWVHWFFVDVFPPFFCRMCAVDQLNARQQVAYK